MYRFVKAAVAVGAATACLVAAGPAGAATSRDSSSSTGTLVNGPFGPGLAFTPAQDAVPGGPVNPSGLPAYFVYQDGGQVSPQAADFPLQAIPASGPTVCADSPFVNPQGKGAAEIYAKITCENPQVGNVVSNTQLILWQRKNPNGTGGWTKTGGVRTPQGGVTPYNTGSYLNGCTDGYQIHTEFICYVTTPNGAGPEDNNSDNDTCP